MNLLESRNATITVSLGIAIVLIVGAYFLSGHSLMGPASASAESTEALLKEYAAKDTDGDGLPDWEEALYGTDPNNAHSVRANLTDGQAVSQGLATPRYAGNDTATTTSDISVPNVPGPTAASNSLTDQFAKIFFNNYISTRGTTPPTAEESQAFVQSAVADLVQTRAVTDTFSASDIKVSGSGTDALRAYAVAAEQAFKQNASNTTYGEGTYLSDAVERNDTSAIKNLKIIADSYAATAKALAAIPVPKEAAVAHLALANAMARLGATVADFASVNDDPIRGMLGIGSYDKDSAAFLAALQAEGTVFTSAGVTFASTEPGYGFFRTATALNEAAASSTTP